MKFWSNSNECEQWVSQKWGVVHFCKIKRMVSATPPLPRCPNSQVHWLTWQSINGRSPTSRVEVYKEEELGTKKRQGKLTKKCGIPGFWAFHPWKLQQSNTCGDPSRVSIYRMFVQPLAVDIVTSTSRFRSFMLVLTEIFTSLCDGVRPLLVKKCLGKVYWLDTCEWKKGRKYSKACG